MAFHLPSSRHSETFYIRLDTSRCKACWDCVEACPQDVLGKVDFRFHRHARVDHAENCKGCFLCVDACTHQAILIAEKTRGSVLP